ncbi:LacI family DNA-binding transcriptional regulator [Bacillus manliponensis]|uniref:LacI family DNA-binding transcriptional regulator n=1 Tax=Bacillus manliponensis TaxID=574376 RepID=UPI003515E10A
MKCISGQGGKIITTIGDIAKLAGVSKATVSRVLNNHPYVRPELRERVQNVIDQTNYVPLSVAKDLRRLQTNLIGVVVPTLHHPFFGKLIEEISDVLKEDGYDVVILQSNYKEEKERDFLQYVRTKKLDGLIFSTLSIPREELERIADLEAVVVCNEHTDITSIPKVEFNEEEAGYIGTVHLLQAGYKKIGFCYDTLTSEAQCKRFQGYKQALYEQRIEMNPNWVFANCYRMSDGKQIVRTICSMSEPIDAIFTGSDEVAAGIIMESQRNGIIVPKNLGVIGFDNQPLSSMMCPSITTIHTSISSMAKHTVALLDRRLQHSKLPVEHISLPVSIIERESTRRR